MRANRRLPRTMKFQIFRDTEDVVHANVPRDVVLHAPPGEDPDDKGYDFGLDGALSPGGLDLALNALNAYVPPGSDGLPPVRCEKGLASKTARDLHEDFAVEFLMEPDPDHGEVLGAREIYDWIEAKRPGTIARIKKT